MIMTMEKRVLYTYQSHTHAIKSVFTNSLGTVYVQQNWMYGFTAGIFHVTPFSTSATSITAIHNTRVHNDLWTSSIVNVMVSARQSTWVEETKINQISLRKKILLPHFLRTSADHAMYEAAMSLLHILYVGSP
jgi:hypothetical protein